MVSSPVQDVLAISVQVGVVRIRVPRACAPRLTAAHSDRSGRGPARERENRGIREAFAKPRSGAMAGMAFGARGAGDGRVHGRQQRNAPGGAGIQIMCDTRRAGGTGATDGGATPGSPHVGLSGPLESQAFPVTVRVQHGASPNPDDPDDSTPGLTRRVACAESLRSPARVRSLVRRCTRLHAHTRATSSGRRRARRRRARRPSARGSFRAVQGEDR